MPVEDLLADLSREVGLENDGVVISENFRDFELDSTDVIRNL